MRNKVIILLLLCISLIFSGCFSSWQEETGTIILNLGSNSRMAFPPTGQDQDELKYEVTFIGANDEFTVNSEGIEPVKATVIPGDWKITVKAFYYDRGNSANNRPAERIMYAIGKENVRVKPGQSNTVTVIMSNMGEIEVNIDISAIREYFSNNQYPALIINDIFNHVSFKVLGHCTNDPADYSNTLLDTTNVGPHIIPLKSGKWNFELVVYFYDNQYIVDRSYNSLTNGGITTNIFPGGHEKIVFSFDIEQISKDDPGELYLIELNSDYDATKGTVKINCNNDIDKWYTKAYATEGTQITIKAEPNEGFKFEGCSVWNDTEGDWLDDVEEIKDNIRHFNMPSSNVTITPHFQ
jgi:hypothetical protein